MANKLLARVTVHGSPGLSRAGRRRLAAWLRRVAQTVARDDVDTRYVARYWTR
jgi:hypothetical protein